MSEQEKKSGATAADASSVVMVEQTTESRHKQPYRPTELEEEAPELHHKAVAEELKDVCEDSNASNNADIKERKEFANVMSSDKQKQVVAMKLSTNAQKREASPETITLAPIEVETKFDAYALAPQPQEPMKEFNAAHAAGKAVDTVEDGSIKEDIVELRTPEVAKKHSEWSDEEEAGGLPRSTSRSSRVSRTVRQLFCCGVPYEAPSEDDISTQRGFAGI